MKYLARIFAVMAVVAGAGHAATIITNASGLTVDTFNNGTFSGTSFTDAMGNVLTDIPQTPYALPTAPAYVWFLNGELVATFTSPVTAVGFTFLNLCLNCSPGSIANSGEFVSVSLNNGDSYNTPLSIPAGLGVPASLFVGISSATPFMQAIFTEAQLTSSEISDFRFNTSTAPEPEPSHVIAPALALLAAGLKLRARRQRC